MSRKGKKKNNSDSSSSSSSSSSSDDNNNNNDNNNKDRIVDDDVVDDDVDSLSGDGLLDKDFQDDLRALAANFEKDQKELEYTANEVGIDDKIKEFSFPSDLDWIEFPVIVSKESHVHDKEQVEDDLEREYAFYKRAVGSVVVAQDLLEASNTPFVRPADYFAEMVKSDQHMLKVKASLLRARGKLEAMEKNRRDRELKKLGKQVQTERRKAKQMHKSAQASAIKQWRDKRKRNGGVDDFDLSLLDEAVRLDGKAAKRVKPLPNARRQAKNRRFGSGPVRKGPNRNTAESSLSLGNFYSKKDKRAGARGKRRPPAKRPGKNARAANRNRR